MPSMNAFLKARNFMISKKLSLFAMLLFLGLSSSNCIHTIFIDDQTSIDKQFPKVVAQFNNFIGRVQSQKEYDFYVRDDYEFNCKEDQTEFIPANSSIQEIKERFENTVDKSGTLKLVELKTKKSIGYLIVDRNQKSMNLIVTR